MAAYKETLSIMADWSNFPEDLVVSIAKRVGCLEDFMKFRSLVYKPWSLVVTKQNFTVQELPWLMTRNGFPSDYKTRWFFCRVTTNQIYKPHITTRHNRVVCYSSLGWLITVDKYKDVKLFHPLRPASEVIELGRIEYLTSSMDEVRKKYVLSSSPSCTSDYTVMALEFSGLSVFHGNKWIFTYECTFDDIAYYRGQFYGVERFKGGVFVFDIKDPQNLKKRDVASAMPKAIVRSGQYLVHRYLVESGGSLLVVLHLTVGKTIMFRVFKVPFCNSKWLNSEVKDLGTRSLFLSTRNSFSLEASNYNSCRANCIYFAELYVWGKPCIFSMKDGKVEELPCQQGYYDFWFQPSF